MKEKIDIEELWLVTITTRLGQIKQHITSKIDFNNDIGAWASEEEDLIKCMTIEIFEI